MGAYAAEPVSFYDMPIFKRVTGASYADQSAGKLFHVWVSSPVLPFAQGVLIRMWIGYQGSGLGGAFGSSSGPLINAYYLRGHPLAVSTPSGAGEARPKYAYYSPWVTDPSTPFGQVYGPTNPNASFTAIWPPYDTMSP